MKILLLLAGLMMFANSAQADELLETYVAKLGSADHFNSKGKRLTNVAAIIRQDRANFHKFGVMDEQDEWDSFFASKSNRALLESMLNRGFIAQDTKRAIINGTPVIVVKVYAHHIEVAVDF